MKKLIPIIFMIIFPFSLFSASPQMTLVEEVTSGNCGACASQNVGFNDYISKNLDKIVPVIYHSGNGLDEPMYDHNPGMLGNRIWGTYVSGTLGTPAAWANGKKVALTQVQGEVIQNSKKESPISIYILERREGNYINVTVIVHTDDAIIGDKRLFLVVVEDEVRTPSALRNGERVFPWVARGMLPGAHPSQGEKIFMAPGESKTFKYSFAMHQDWDPTKIWIAGFIQDYADANKKVLQAARTMDASKAKPQIALSAHSLDFKKIADSKVMSLEISNTGLADLIINEMSIVNDADGVFTLLNGGVNTIGPYEKVNLEIEFTPKTNKNYSAVLKIKSNSTSGAMQDIQLYGIGFGVVPQPKIACNVSSLDFGSTDSEVTKTFELSNTGAANLVIEKIDINYDADGVYSVNANLPVSIEPSAKLELTVKFKPIYNNIFGAQIVINSNATNSPEIKIDLVGVGEGVKTYAILSSDFENLDFGKVHDSKSLDLKLTNSGYKTLEFAEIIIRGDDANFFSFVGKMPTKLDHDDSQTLKVKFEPKSDRAYSAEVFIKSNADNKAEFIIPLTGIGDGWTSVSDYYASEIFAMSASPNPAGDITRINYNVKKQINSTLTINLFDIKGSIIKKLINTDMIEGEYEFDIDFSGIPSGIYYMTADFGMFRLQTPISIVR